MFTPITVDNALSREDIFYIQDCLNDETSEYLRLYDEDSKRFVVENLLLDKFSRETLEPLAKKLFNDETLLSSYSVYSIYDSPDSNLEEHIDMHPACVYNISYCLQQVDPWEFTVDGKSYYLPENSLIAYLGTESPHGRPKLSTTNNKEVKMIFFHFAPKDSWIFSRCSDFYPDLED